MHALLHLVGEGCWHAFYDAAYDKPPAHGRFLPTLVEGSPRPPPRAPKGFLRDNRSRCCKCGREKDYA